MLKIKIAVGLAVLFFFGLLGSIIGREAGGIARFLLAGGLILLVPGFLLLYFGFKSRKKIDVNKSVRKENQQGSEPKQTISKKKILILLSSIAIITLLAILGSTEGVQWNNAKRDNTIESYRVYLQKYPNGVHASEAINQIGILGNDPILKHRGTKYWGLIKKDVNEYEICGMEIINKEVGGVFKMVQEPSLFIFLMQNKKFSKELKVKVSQKNGYSIDHITIDSDCLTEPITIKGEGKFWGDRISGNLSVGKKTYEHPIVVPQDKYTLPLSFHIEVAYCWIYQGKGVPSGKFVNMKGSGSANITVE